MKKLSDNFLSLVLLLILAVSPVQNTIASVSHANTMTTNTVQQEMTDSRNMDMQNSNCNAHQANQCKCDISHCATVSFIILPTAKTLSLSFNHIPFTLSSDSDFIQPLVSSLYRPPRI